MKDRNNPKEFKNVSEEGGNPCTRTNETWLYVNSEGFLAEVFHPWVRWEGPGSGFENSSGGAGAVWKSRIHRFGPLGIEVEKQGFRTAWLITFQKFP